MGMALLEKMRKEDPDPGYDPREEEMIAAEYHPLNFY